MLSYCPLSLSIYELSTVEVKKIASIFHRVLSLQFLRVLTVPHIAQYVRAFNNAENVGR